MYCRFRFGVQKPKHFCLKPGQQSQFRSDCAVAWALNSSKTPSLFLKDDIIYIVLKVPAHYFPNFFLFLCLFFWDSYTSVWSRLFFDAFVHFLSTGFVYKRKQQQNKMSARKMKKKDRIKLRFRKLSTARNKQWWTIKTLTLFIQSLYWTVRYLLPFQNWLQMWKMNHVKTGFLRCT